MTGLINIVERLRVGGIVIDHLPELPGFNGSILTIDDVESAKCAHAMFDGAAEITRLRVEAEALRNTIERVTADAAFRGLAPSVQFAVILADQRRIQSESKHEQ